MLFARCATVLALVLVAGAAPAQIYRWTDEKGRVQISDTPPPPGARNVEKRAPAGAAGAPQNAPNEPYALQLARKTAPVTLYSTPNCEPCNKARGLLNARGVPFMEINVVSEKQVEELMKAVGGNAVPSLVVGSTVQQGFEETAYHGILDAAGYPKTGVLPPRAQEEPRSGAPKAEAPAAEPAPSGPYAPGARGSQKK
ncbi:glutaredoxin family protein [Piscinibacter sp.]|jgi:glutaredoxin|uniref:glutaredoxin family protein n=1 Tax=Piscinibacter sp. TaxID=1903157 RepID=UPI002F403DB6